MLPNEILVGRYQKALARLFGIQAMPPSPQLAEEVVPVWVLNGEHPEDYFLRDEFLASGYIRQLGVAASRSVIQLRNPPGSGILIIVDRVLGFSGNAATDEVDIGFGLQVVDLAGLPAAGGITYRDARQGITPTGGTATRAPAGHLTSDPSPPTIFAPNVGKFVSSTALPFDLNRLDCVLLPGWAVQLANVTVNITLSATIHWRERPVTQMETAR